MLYFPTHDASGLFSTISSDNTAFLQTGWSYVAVPAALGHFDLVNVTPHNPSIEWYKLENEQVRDATVAEILASGLPSRQRDALRAARRALVKQRVEDLASNATANTLPGPSFFRDYFLAVRDLNDLD